MGSARVTVVGGGIVGLTTALRLLEEGFDVEVVTDRLGESCTSGVAGAVWYPYKLGESPDERTYEWAAETHATLLRLASIRGSGVLKALPMWVFAGGTAESTLREEPEWARRVPRAECKAIALRDLPEPLKRHASIVSSTIETEGAFRFLAPVVDPAMHLSWLRARLGGRVRLLSAPVAELESLPGDVVVNCAGRRARLLTKDTGLNPAFGQVLVTKDSVQRQLHLPIDDNYISPSLRAGDRRRGFLRFALLSGFWGLLAASVAAASGSGCVSLAVLPAVTGTATLRR